MKKIDKDTIWTWIIVFVIVGYFILISFAANGQVKDTLNSKKLEYQYQKHKTLLQELENPEKYQMIYFDKAIIDKKNKRVYLYSSYDLVWAEELGFGIEITLPKIKLKKKKN